MAPHFAPPPTRIGSRTVVTPDVTRIDASLRFDVASGAARAEATVDFVMDGPGGNVALDLRQPIEHLELDGRKLDVDHFAPLDVGGGDGAEVRVLDVSLETGSAHQLRCAYRLGTPDTGQAVPVSWADGGVRFDFWMSDLYPGRYLEQWIPAPLCHDRFALNVAVAVTGTDRPHLLVTNGGVGIEAGSAWRASYPATFTSLSPMLVLAPEDDVEWRHRQVTLTGRAHPVEVRCARHREIDADLEAVEADVASWLAYLHARYGPWAHGDAMTAFVWGPGRGMEYDGATTAAVGAMEHEVFHSWFGRGVKPAGGRDGWIDEAITVWATASRRVEGSRFAAVELALDEEPVELCPASPWSRHTPTAAYGAGARLFSGIAHLLGGADRLRSAMAAFYTANRGGLITTDDLEAHLQSWADADLGPLWARYVHGRG